MKRSCRLGVAVRGASTRSPVQTLAGVLIRADDGKVELQATDMELGVRVALDTTDSSPGQAVVPGRLLLDVVRSLPKDDLSLEYRSAGQDVEVVSGPARFHLRTLPADDFPKLPEAGRRDASPCPPRPSSRRSTAWPAPPRATRRARTSPACSCPPAARAAHGRHRLVSAERQGDDARRELERVARGERAGADAPGAEPDRSAARAETIDVAALEHQVVFTVDDVVLSSRLVEGRFPNYKQLLPEAFEHELRVNGDELLEVVRRIGLLAQKNAPLRLRFTEGTLEISAQTPDVGEASESLPVPFKGETLEIGFNPDFFREGLESAESDELILKLISPLRPGLIQSGDEDAGFLYLVMPIRLNV